MTLNEFINHIKHKSLGITILDANDIEVLYAADVGCYLTSTAKNTIGNRLIDRITPIGNNLTIYLSQWEV